jgi:hypothetical protein
VSYTTGEIRESSLSPNILYSITYGMEVKEFHGVGVQTKPTLSQCLKYLWWCGERIE